MYLIARGAEGLASWDDAEREKVPPENFSQEARSYEGHTRSGTADFHREVDTQDHFFVEREALPAWAVATPPRNGFTANAYQNSAQPRIHRVDRAARDGIENDCRGVFADPTGKDTGHSTRRNVPLGETTPQARAC